MLTWLKRNPVYGLIVMLVPVVGFLSSLPGALSFVAQVSGRPSPCWTYSDVYYYAGGHFRNTGGGTWMEYQPAAKMTFQEFSRDRNYITLLNKTPRTVDPRWASMLVRLPVCGGTAQWTEEDPQSWVDLYQVTPDVPAQIAAQQQAYEQPAQ